MQEKKTRSLIDLLKLFEANGCFEPPERAQRGGVIFAPKDISPEDSVRQSMIADGLVPGDKDKSRSAEVLEPTGKKMTVNYNGNNGSGRTADNRFQPGQSGNRRGRPKGVKNRKTIVKKIALETHSMTRNGVSEQVTTAELALLELRNKVALGDAQALRYHGFLSKKYGLPITDKRVGVAVMPAEISCEEWWKREQERNRTRKPPPGYDE